MTADTEPDASPLAPDDAFAVLGNETRMEILRTLGVADRPLSFSDLRERVGMRDSGQFNYHLDKLVGHFVTRTDEKYELREAGRRIIEAVLSGAVSAAPVMEPSPIDEPCPMCGGDTVVAFTQQHVHHYCTECAGHARTSHTAGDRSDGGDDTAIDDSSASDDTSGEQTYGFLGSFQFPPAGLQNRTPDAVFRAAATWGVLELLAIASGVCPRCSAPLEESVSVCETHDPAGEFCKECGNRHAVHVRFCCSNCRHDQSGPLGLALVADSQVLSFLLKHGVNPVSPSAPSEYYAAILDYEETVRSADPFEGRVTLTVAGDSLSLVVDDDLQVTAVA